MRESSPDFIKLLKENGIEFHDFRKPVYKYVSVDTAKLILQNKRLRFKLAKSFNDPFELTEDFFDFNINYEDLRNHLQALFMRTNPNMTEREALRKARGFDRKYVVNKYQQILASWKEDYLMFCASRSNTKTLMWTHYAESHTGICLGILVPPYMEWGNKKVEQFSLCVRYTEEILPINFFDTFQDSEKEPIWSFKWLLSKSKDWSYEEEVRTIITDLDHIVQREDGLFFDMPFSTGLVKELYFGLRTSTKDIKEITDILKAQGYDLEKIGRMEMEKGAYRLQVAPHSI